MSDNIILNKSKKFAIRIIKLYKYLCENKNEYVLSKQLIRSGTSIGANVREATVSQSKKEFISKMNIALKEAYESEYWLELFKQAELTSNDTAVELTNIAGKIRRMLMASINTAEVNP